MASRRAAVPRLKGSPIKVDSSYFYDCFHYAPTAIMVADAEGKMLHANPAALTLLGYDLNDFRKLRLPDLHAPFDKIAEDLPRLVAAGGAHREVGLRCKDARVIDADLHGYVLGNGHLLAFFEDITEEKRARNAERESEERFRAFFNQITDAVAIYAFDANGGPGPFLEVNEAACRLLGYSREELLGTPPSDFRTQDSELLQDLKQRLFAGQTVCYEQTLTTADRREIPVEIRAKLFPFGSQPALIAICHDISERRLAEQSLRENASRLEMALEAGRAGVYEHDLTKGTITGDLRHAQMFGFSGAARQWKRELFQKRFHPEDGEVVARALELSDKSGYGQAEFRVIWPDGSMHWLHARSRSLTDESGRVVKRVGTVVDVTEKRAAEEALRESESLFHTLADNIAQLAWMSDASGSRFWFNQRWYDYTGTALPDVNGWGWQTVHHPDHLARVMEHIRNSTRGGKPWEDTVQLRGQNGEYRWFLCRVVPICDDGGNLVRWFGTNTDVTELRQAELKAQEAHAKLEAALASMTDAVFISDTDGNFVDCNEAFATFHRFHSKDECATAVADYPAILDVFAQDGLPAPLEMWAVPRALRGETVPNAEYRLRRKDTGETWFGSYSFGPIRDGLGTIVGSVVIARDITEQKQAESALQDALKLNQQIIDSASEGIIVYGLDFRYRVWNPYMEHLTGVPARDVLGRAALDVFPFLQEVGVMERLEKSLMGEMPRAIEFPFAIPNGRRGWVADMSGPLRNGTGDIVGVIATVRDVSEQKYAEEEKSKLQAQFIQAQKMQAVGQLAGGVAHDFNNLLQIIMSYGELLQEQFGDNETALHKTDCILKAAQRATTLTRQLLAFSRKQVLHPVVIDLNTVVESTMKMLQRLLPENIEFRLDLQHPLWRTEADPDQMTHVLINLAVNARDAMPDGGTMTIITQNAPVSPETPDVPPMVAPGEYVMMIVRDTGEGIDAEGMNHLFEPFYTTKEKGKGTGLGLASVYGILRQSSGFVWAKSSVGEGACFTTCLPRTEKLAAIDVRPPAKVRRTTPATLLVVDDAAEVRYTLAEHAKSLGYKVRTASPEEALDLAKQYVAEIDVLITDVVMPRTSGPRLAAHLKAINPRIKILFMSGYSDLAADGPDIPHNQAVRLSKPFGRRELALKIKEVLSM